MVDGTAGCGTAGRTGFGLGAGCSSVAVAQSVAGGGTTGFTDGSCGTGSGRAVVAGSGDGGSVNIAAILTGSLLGTGFCAGSGLGGRIAAVVVAGCGGDLGGQATGGTGFHRGALSGTGCGLQNGGRLSAVLAGALAHGGADNGEVVRQQSPCGVELFSGFCITGVIAIVRYSDDVSVFTGGQVAKGGGIIYCAVVQNVLIVRDLSGTAGDLCAIGAEAGVDINPCLGDGGITGGNGAGDIEDVSCYVTVRCIVVRQLNVIVQLFDVIDTTGVDVAGGSVAGFNPIPHIAGGVGVHTGGGINGINGCFFDLFRGAVGTGFGIKLSCGFYFDFDMGGIEGALIEVSAGFGAAGVAAVGTARIGTRAALRRVAVKAVLLNDGGVVLIAKVCVIVTGKTADIAVGGVLIHTKLGGVGVTVGGPVIGAVAIASEVVGDPRLIFCTDGIHVQQGGVVLAGVHTGQITLCGDLIHKGQTDILL